MRITPIRGRIRFLLAALLVTTLVTTLGTFWALAQNQPAGRASAQQKVLVLRGGLLIDGTGGGPLNNAVVTIAGGKIQSVGRDGSVTIPADATVIDATGKTIIPGLVDTHIHFRNYHAPSYLYWGVTSVGDLGNSIGWVLAYKDAIAKGRVAGPYIMAAGGKFSTPPKANDGLSAGDMRGFDTFLSGNSQMSYVWDQASAERVVGASKKAGIDGVKLYTRMSPPLMKITAEVAHRYGLPVFSHYDAAFTIEDILDTGIDTQAHLNGLVASTVPKDVRERTRGPAWHLMDTSKFPTLVQKMIEKKIILQPTLKREFERASKHLGEFARLNAAFVKSPVVASLPEPIRARFDGAFPGGKAEPGNEQLVEGFRRAGMFVKQFADMGGKVVAASDFGANQGIPGFNLHEELQMLAETGMKPMQIIQSATSWAMDAWGKSKEVGTLEPGKRADLLVLNRNPLDDMSATTDIFRVIQGGSVIDRDGLAKWQETMPRPMPVQSGNFPNLLLHIPFIVEISPEWIPTNAKNASELTITGENFSKESLVLINDRLVTPKSQTDEELRVPIPAELPKKSGVFTVEVVQPGSAGGVSNPVYIMVTPN